jgi:phage gpG-like protein
VKLKIEVEGLDRTSVVLTNLSNGVRGGRLMEDVGRAGMNMIKRRISVEKTTPSGKPWKPNLDGTSTLVRSGGLLDSITYISGETKATIGTDWPYASIHNYGATIRSGGYMRFMSGGSWWRTKLVQIPAREFMGWSDNNVRELENVVRQSLMQWLP